MSIIVPKCFTKQMFLLLKIKNKKLTQIDRWCVFLQVSSTASTSPMGLHQLIHWWTRRGALLSGFHHRQGTLRNSLTLFGP